MAEIKVSIKAIRVYYLITELQDIVGRLLQIDKMILPAPLEILKESIGNVIENIPGALVDSNNICDAIKALELLISGLQDIGGVLKSPEPNRRAAVIASNNLLSALNDLKEPPLSGGLTAKDTEFVSWCSVRFIYESIYEKWDTCRRFNIFIPSEGIQTRSALTFQGLSVVDKNRLSNSSIPGRIFETFRIDTSVPYVDVEARDVFVKSHAEFVSLKVLYAPDSLIERVVCSKSSLTRFSISDCMEAYADLGKVLAALEQYYFLIFKIYGGSYDSSYGS